MTCKIFLLSRDRDLLSRDISRDRDLIKKMCMSCMVFRTFTSECRKFVFVLACVLFFCVLFCIFVFD